MCCSKLALASKNVHGRGYRVLVRLLQVSSKSHSSGGPLEKKLSKKRNSYSHSGGRLGNGIEYLHRSPCLIHRSPCMNQHKMLNYCFCCHTNYADFGTPFASTFITLTLTPLNTAPWYPYTDGLLNEHEEVRKIGVNLKRNKTFRGF